MPLLALHKLSDVGTDYFNKWKFVSSYDHWNQYQTNFEPNTGGVVPFQNGDQILLSLKLEESSFLLSDYDEFFDYGDFCIYVSGYNDWAILTNDKNLDFQRPEGFKGLSEFYTGEEMAALFGA